MPLEATIQALLEQALDDNLPLHGTERWTITLRPVEEGQMAGASTFLDLESGFGRLAIRLQVLCVTEGDTIRFLPQRVSIEMRPIPGSNQPTPEVKSDLDLRKRAPDMAQACSMILKRMRAVIGPKVFVLMAQQATEEKEHS